MRFYHLLAAAGAFASAASLSAGTVLFNNIGEASAGAHGIEFAGPLYDSFLSGATAGPIADLELVLDSGATGSSGSFQVGLYADNSSAPGALIAVLGTIRDNQLTGTPSAYDLLLNADPVLASETLYWIGLTGTTSAEWDYDSDAGGTDVAGEFFSNQIGVFPDGWGPYQMSVTRTGAIAPEPSSVGLMVAGFALLLLRSVLSRSRRKLGDG